MLDGRIEDGLVAILAKRLEFFAIDATVEEIVAREAMPALARFYTDKDGSIRHVLAALDVAVATAVDNGDPRLEVGHVRIGIGDWQDR